MLHHHPNLPSRNDVRPSTIKYDLSFWRQWPASIDDLAVKQVDEKKVDDIPPARRALR